MKRSKHYILILLFVLTQFTCIAQQIDIRSDLLIIKQKIENKLPDPYKRPYIYKDEHSLLKQVNPIGILYGSALYFYQNKLSKHISSQCLYTPGCSDFSKEAVNEFGIIKGTLLSADRLTRCSIFSVGELKKQRRDPVTSRYPDPVSKYANPARQNGN